MRPHRQRHRDHAWQMFPKDRSELQHGRQGRSAALILRGGEALDLDTRCVAAAQHDDEVVHPVRTAMYPIGEVGAQRVRQAVRQAVYPRASVIAGGYVVHDVEYVRGGVVHEEEVGVPERQRREDGVVDVVRRDRRRRGGSGPGRRRRRRRGSPIPRCGDGNGGIERSRAREFDADVLPPDGGDARPELDGLGIEVGLQPLQAPTNSRRPSSRRHGGEEEGGA